MFSTYPATFLGRSCFAKVLQDRGLKLLQSEGIEVLLGVFASEVTKDEVRAHSPHVPYIAFFMVS